MKKLLSFAVIATALAACSPSEERDAAVAVTPTARLNGVPASIADRIEREGPAGLPGADVALVRPDAAKSGGATTATDLACTSACVQDSEIQSVSWSKITGVPEGFADGIDNDTTYSAGTGLTLTGTTFSIAQAAITADLVAPGALDERHMLTPHMGLVASTSDVVVRSHYMTMTSGVSSARIRIVSGGNNATWSGSGTATIMVNGSVFATFGVGGDGNLPWTYITSPIPIQLGTGIQVLMRANTAGKPVVLRDVDVDFQ